MKKYPSKLDILFKNTLYLYHNIKEMEGSTDLKKKVGLMTADEAAAVLGVSMSFFRLKVSKHIGRYIGSRKYFTQGDLEQWLMDQTLVPAKVG